MKIIIMIGIGILAYFVQCFMCVSNLTRDKSYYRLGNGIMEESNVSRAKCLILSMVLLAIAVVAYYKIVHDTPVLVVIGIFLAIAVPVESLLMNFLSKDEKDKDIEEQKTTVFMANLNITVTSVYVPLIVNALGLIELS